MTGGGGAPAGHTEVVVGRIGRPHGIKGEVTVEVRTDEPDRRFATGAVLSTAEPGPARSGTGRPVRLTVAGTRRHQSRLLVGFTECTDRDQAEALRGLLLLARVDPGQTPEDPEEYYDHQLIGSSVVTVAGAPVGELSEVVHGTAQDLLAVRLPDGSEVLVPFVAQLVPVVDLPHRRVVVADLPGLLRPAAEDEDGA